MPAPGARAGFPAMADDEKRDRREAALGLAVQMHGEWESQPMFRDHELDAVFDTAKRFYDWIVDGPADAT